MRILIVSATEEEIKPFEHTTKDIHIDILITGVGMVATTYHLTKKLIEQHFDIVINIGIAGAFTKGFKIGDVVEVQSECFSEIGVEDNHHFISAFEAGLISPNEFPFINRKLVNPDAGKTQLKTVPAITVNRVHGNENSISEVEQQFAPEIESMEGAAVAYVCLQQKVQFIQVRAISNYVEKRNKDTWNIQLAIANLNNELKRIVQVLEQNNLK